jgi:hypothetical protein
MNDGKKIEKIVRIIQETLKDSHNTKIYSNYKIENTSGRKREIDVLIDSIINSMTIKIAIECKNYRAPVPVEKIEAFNSKCSRIKGISKKVFVSASGYQADAIEAAKTFEIELFSVKEISKESIIGWFPIFQLITQFKIKVPLKIGVDGDKTAIKNLPEEGDLILHYFDGIEKSIHIIDYVWNSIVVVKQDDIRTELLSNFITKKETDKISRHFSFPFSIKLKGVYTKAADGSQIYINQIDSEIEAWLEETPANLINVHSFNNDLGKSKAKTLTFDAGQNTKTDFVFADNKLGLFHTDSSGNVIELKTLAKYDPKTDQLEIFNENKNEG